ncbi:uncharacterized protein BXZ73DRAFT_103973 [Epithele typhae]|uniref:uncharacterized protein n=1 Tax=Epithele typhae TaxID=378194 RepID=UPI002008C69A|nr:uncharacterized protein BXZ73DRAFT_103973 [Epithele typhae]KAH9923179.1 hypothetical protein BXZ73DRAFT_103973 [Epithele typhae]
MRAGYFAALLLSAVAVRAVPAPVQQERDLGSSLEQAASGLFGGIDIGSALGAAASPILGSILGDATAVVGSMTGSNPALAGLTSVLGAATSIVGSDSGAKGATGKSNDASPARMVSMGAAVFGSMLLGAYAVL